MTPTYAYYLNGSYLFPVSHSHACDLIGVEIPLSDAVGTSYERDMGDGIVLLTRMPDRAPEGGEDRFVGYNYDGSPIGG